MAHAARAGENPADIRSIAACRNEAARLPIPSSSRKIETIGLLHSIRLRSRICASIAASEQGEGGRAGQEARARMRAVACGACRRNERKPLQRRMINF